jgi:hypothetical protein
MNLSIHNTASSRILFDGNIPGCRRILCSSCDPHFKTYAAFWFRKSAGIFRRIATSCAIEMYPTSTGRSRGSGVHTSSSSAKRRWSAGPAAIRRGPQHKAPLLPQPFRQPHNRPPPIQRRNNHTGAAQKYRKVDHQTATTTPGPPPINTGPNFPADKTDPAVCWCGWEHTKLGSCDAFLCPKEGGHWAAECCHIRLSPRALLTCRHHHRSILTPAATLWRKSVNVIRLALPRKPWVCNVKYTPLKYQDFKKSIMRADSTHPIVVSRNHDTPNITTAFDVLLHKPSDNEHLLGDTVPYFSGCTSRFILFSVATHSIFRVFISINTDAPHITVEPIVVLPDDPGIYNLTLSIPCIFFNYNWKIDVTDRGANTVFELPASRLPHPPGMFHDLGFVLKLVPYMLVQ